MFEIFGGDAAAIRRLGADEVRSRALGIEQTRAALKRYGVADRIKY